MFKYVLTQEVAYGGLLQERRRALHPAIVRAFEGLDPERAGEQRGAGSRFTCSAGIKGNEPPRPGAARCRPWTGIRAATPVFENGEAVLWWGGDQEHLIPRRAAGVGAQRLPVDGQLWYPRGGESTTPCQDHHTKGAPSARGNTSGRMSQLIDDDVSTIGFGC